jgi:hypothetical protein
MAEGMPPYTAVLPSSIPPLIVQRQPPPVRRLAVLKAPDSHTSTAFRTCHKAAASRTDIRQMSSAYIKFARDNRSLYEAMMGFHAPEHDPTSHESLWTFTVEQVQRIPTCS